MTVQPTRDQLRALADAATPGPWMHDRDQNDGWMVVFGGNEYPHGYNIIGSNEYLEPGDAAFIAAARTALPQLLDQLDRWERRSGGHIQADVDEWCDENDLLHEDLHAAVSRAEKAEARIKAVEDVLDNPIHLVGWDDPLVPAAHVRRALESVPPASA